jgi:hypothetical protein
MVQTSQRKWQHVPAPTVLEKSSNNRPFLCRTLYNIRRVEGDHELSVDKDLERNCPSLPEGIILTLAFSD